MQKPREDGHVGTETGVHQAPPEAGRVKEGLSPKVTSRNTALSTMILDFWSPEGERIGFCCSQSPGSPRT